MDDTELPPGLYLVATPIGNMGDITARAIKTFKSADTIVCEDTRETKKLLKLLNVDYSNKKIFSSHEHNELQRCDEIVELIRGGAIVAYSSDAGMPAISDPGAVLVNRIHEENLLVSCMPGPSAVTTAIALSGFTNKSFKFYGFLARSGKERTTFFQSLENNLELVVIYESPNRIEATLESMFEVLGDRSVVVCRELTKKFEEVKRGSAKELQADFSGGVKGECVIVIDSARNISEPSIENDKDVQVALDLLFRSGVSSRDAVEVLEALTTYPKNEIKKAYGDIRDA